MKYEEERGGKPDDFGIDPAALGKQTRVGYEWGVSLPRPPQPQSEDEVLAFVEFLARHFKEHIERQRGYELLWSKGFKRRLGEKAAQRVFQAMARGLCDTYDVDMSKETDAGTGPVDFKFSTGHRSSVLVELKHISSSKFWNGIVAQLPDYLRAQDAHTGLFIAIAYSDAEVRGSRCRELPKRLKAASNETGYRLRGERVNATPRRLSASRL